MIASRLMSAIGLMATSASLAHALGCYSGGKGYSELSGGSVDGAIQYFCRNDLPSTFSTDETVDHCFSFPENNSGDRVNIQLRNIQGSGATLSYDDCVHYFGVERSACRTGSEQNHGAFFYKIDPNEGPC